MIGVRESRVVDGNLDIGFHPLETLDSTPFFTSTRHDSQRKRKDTHEGAAFCVLTARPLIFVTPSSIKKISYNAIILARMVLFWCVPVLPPAQLLSLCHVYVIVEMLARLR